jgi:hypothetical protein
MPAQGVGNAWSSSMPMIGPMQLQVHILREQRSTVAPCHGCDHADLQYGRD